MRPVHTLSLTTLLAALAPLAQAQEAPSESAGPRRVQLAGPAQYHRLDLDTGLYTLDVPPPPGSGAACFANDVDVDPGLTINDAVIVDIGEEIVDWGVKSCGSSGLVESIEIGYASPASVSGGSLTLRIYAGTQGFGTLGTEVFSVSLTGLPTGGTFPFDAIPQVVTIDLGSAAFFLPDGPIGWGYQNVDGVTAPSLRDVGPLNSTQNFLDWYKPGPASAGFLEQTFSFGPGPSSFDPFENSTHIVLTENDGTQLASLVALASANPNALAANAPKFGSSWDFSFNPAVLPGTTSTQVLFSLGVLPAPLTTPFGEVLVDPAGILPTVASTGTDHSFPLTGQSSILGLSFYAQGAAFAGASLTLTNAYVGTVGF